LLDARLRLFVRLNLLAVVGRFSDKSLTDASRSEPSTASLGLLKFSTAPHLVADEH
jgi:hypothetical protein